ncbi:MAG TPA: hypothetical protein VFE38_08010 [Edaphobacter sp.]|nr:hypothetical protein [Edaphobacter sp.]
MKDDNSFNTGISPLRPFRPSVEMTWVGSQRWNRCDAGATPEWKNESGFQPSVLITMDLGLSPQAGISRAVGALADCGAARFVQRSCDAEGTRLSALKLLYLRSP